ncbi:MAG: hypothetical protein KKB51_16905 [Candidatus Riflebacteria bacterium]|nr:hypothetical protein [Candidatus Riflebacteria bacterium]
MKQNIKDSLVGAGFLLLFAIVLFFVFMGIKYVLIALCAYSVLMLIFDAFYVCAGVRTKGRVDGRRSSDSKFYENDEYGFRRHPNVVAPEEPHGEIVIASVTYLAKNRSDEDEHTFNMSPPIWLSTSMVGREITIFYLPWAPEKVRWISIKWLLLHAILPATVLYLFLSDLR